MIIIDPHWQKNKYGATMTFEYVQDDIAKQTGISFIAIKNLSIVRTFTADWSKSFNIKKERKKTFVAPYPPIPTCGIA